MTTAMTLLIALGVTVFGLMLGPLLFFYFGDEMPSWAEEWGPLASIVLALAGAIGTLVSVVLLAAQAVSG